VQLLGGRFGAPRIGIRVQQPDHAAEGRIPVLAPKGDLVAVELLIVMGAGSHDGRMLRRIGLDDHLAAEHAPAGASGDLRQQLEGALGRTQIGQVKQRVRGDDPHQGHARQIQPFGHHLRANHHIGLAAHKTIQQLLMSSPLARRVIVPAHHARARIPGTELLFNALGAQPEIANAPAAAHRADLRHRLAHIAAMAEQILFSAVVGERQTAP